MSVLMKFCHSKAGAVTPVGRNGVSILLNRTKSCVCVVLDWGSSPVKPLILPGSFILLKLTQ